jgi:hypothetical protein
MPIVNDVLNVKSVNDVLNIVTYWLKNNALVSLAPSKNRPLLCLLET